MPVIVEIQGLERTRDKLGRFSRAIAGEAEAFLSELANDTLEYAQSKAPKDLGAGTDNMYVEGHGLHMSVITPDDYMVVQEFGRVAGAKQPSTLQVAGWGARHGFVGRQAIFALARSIGRRGFRGKFFMTAAAKWADQRVRLRLVVASARIQRYWNGY